MSASNLLKKELYIRLVTRLTPLQWMIVGVLFFEISLFVFILWQVWYPLITDRPKPARVALLDLGGLATVKKFLSEKPILTVSPGSATLNTTKQTMASVSAEIVNASGVSAAAKTLDDKLQASNITVGKTSTAPVTKQTSISLKSNVGNLKETVTRALADTELAIQYATLDDSYPYDIKIVIGKNK